MIQSKPPVTRWCNNLSLAGKRPVRIKLPVTQIQYLREVPGFHSAGHIYSLTPSHTHPVISQIHVPHFQFFSLSHTLGTTIIPYMHHTHLSSSKYFQFFSRSHTLDTIQLLFLTCTTHTPAISQMLPLLSLTHTHIISKPVCVTIWYMYTIL